MIIFILGSVHLAHPHGLPQEMLTSQYMASAKPDVTARRRRVGVVDYACDPVNICEQAARCPGGPWGALGSSTPSAMG